MGVELLYLTIIILILFFGMLLSAIVISAIQTKKRIKKSIFILKEYSSTIRQILMLVGRLNTESSFEKVQEISNRIKQIEKEGDEMEKTLKKIIFSTRNFHIFSKNDFEQINQILILSNNLERLADLALKMAYIHLDRREAHAYITPKLRNFLFEFQEVIHKSSIEFIQNLNLASEYNSKKFIKLENKTNEIYSDAIKYLLKSLEKNEIKPLSAIYCKDLMINYESIGDLLYKSNKIICKWD